MRGPVCNVEVRVFGWVAAPLLLFREPLRSLRSCVCRVQIDFFDIYSDFRYSLSRRSVRHTRDTIDAAPPGARTL